VNGGNVQEGNVLQCLKRAVSVNQKQAFNY